MGYRNDFLNYAIIGHYKSVKQYRSVYKLNMPGLCNAQYFSDSTAINIRLTKLLERRKPYLFCFLTI